MVRPIERELEEARKQVFTDAYQMSVGELTNLYRDEELIISPPFQRLFRWDNSQKSRLVESILIGIPLPSIFVSQLEDGRWELVDGLQRVSTLLQLQGLLSDKGFPPLRLEATKYLPSLEGMVWDAAEGPSLSQAERLDIKRSKLDVKIIRRGSDPQTKFELFQRLNSFGSALTSQEIRNALLVSISPQFVEWIEELAAFEPYVQLLNLSGRGAEGKQDQELVLRFLYLSTMDAAAISQMGSFQDGLEEFSVALAQETDQDEMERLREIFVQTFTTLQMADPKILQKWDHSQGKFKGGFLNTSFEALATSVGFALSKGLPFSDDLAATAKEFWTDARILDTSVTGKSTDQRIKTVVPIGREKVIL
mgnify:CR=1 FL=1